VRAAAAAAPAGEVTSVLPAGDKRECWTYGTANGHLEIGDAIGILAVLSRRGVRVHFDYPGFAHSPHVPRFGASK
jgi:hypothetical protein